MARESLRPTLGPELNLRPLVSADAAQLWEVVSANRQHLDRWLRWSSGIRSGADARAFIEQFEQKQLAGDGFHCGIWRESRLVGGVVCWYIHRHHRNSEVGYWLDAAHVGRGLATRAAAAVIADLFARERVHRVEMQCAVDNHASRAVAERLGLVAEGVRRESRWLTDRFADHVVYGILDREWEAANAS